MTNTDDFSHLAASHELGDEAVPHAILDIADGVDAQLVWRNELGGLTFQIGDRFIKWNPRSTGIDLEREQIRLEWIAGRHPAALVIHFGSNGEAQWLVLDAVGGGSAVGDEWRDRRPEAINALARGLRAIHAIPIDEFPPSWVADSWVAATPSALGPRPDLVEPVLVHGDACAPNTLISPERIWTGNVDFGDLCVGDRWADLAIASLSLDWNFGEGHQQESFDAGAAIRCSSSGYRVDRYPWPASYAAASFNVSSSEASVSSITANQPSP